MPTQSVYHGHLVLASTFLLNFCAIGAFNSAGMYLGPLSSTFPSSSRGTLALYCTLQIVTGLASSLGGGVAQDVLEGTGLGLRSLFFGGGFLMMSGFLVSSACGTLFGVLIGSALMGVGLGLGGFMAGGICVLWFESARGTMLLLAMSGQGLGNVFFAWATAKLLEHYEAYDDPWRPTMRCMGILCVVLCAVASASMRMPKPGEVEEYEKRGQRAEDEAEVTYGSVDTQTPPISPTSPLGGASPQRGRRSSALALERMRIDTGHTRQSILHHGQRRRSTMLGSFQAIGRAPLLQLSDFQRSDVTTSLRSLFGARGASESLRSLFVGGEADENESEYTLEQVSLSRTNIWLNAFTLIACFPFLNMQVLLPQYMETFGMAPSMIGHALAMFGVGDFLSNLTLGAAADRVGARRLFAFAFFVLSLLFFLWPHCTTERSLSAVAFFYGYFCCTISSMPIIILADAYGESSSEHILTLNGITNMFKFPGYLLGPTLAGIVVDESGGYFVAAYVSGLLTLIGTMMLLRIPPPDEQHRQLSLMPKR